MYIYIHESIYYTLVFYTIFWYKFYTIFWHLLYKSFGEGNGTPLQCSCLENPRDGGAWWAAVYGVTQSWTRLKQLSRSSSGSSRIMLIILFLFLYWISYLPVRLPWWLRQQKICLQCRRPGFDLWVQKIPWWMEWHPTLVFLPEEFQGQGSLVGCSPWGSKESDMTEATQQQHIKVSIFVLVITMLLYFCVGAKSLHLCLTLCDPMDHSPPGSSVHGILQARILEWVAMPFSRGSSRPRDQTQVSNIAGRFFTSWAIREAQALDWKGAILISLSL